MLVAWYFVRIERVLRSHAGANASRKRLFLGTIIAARNKKFWAQKSPAGKPAGLRGILLGAGLPPRRPNIVRLLRVEQVQINAEGLQGFADFNLSAAHLLGQVGLSGIKLP